MNGGTQSQLMRCSDKQYYVVKFQNNPQGTRILANELLASILGRRLGLPLPETAIVDVDADLICHTDDLVIQLESGRVPCQGGLCFGSRYPRDTVSEPRSLRPAIDFLPVDLLCGVSNISDFLGMLVFDKWIGNTDDRQSVFFRESGQSLYRALMVDHGFCFNGQEWDFPDRPAKGIYFRGIVYDEVRDLRAFDRWISRIEEEMTETVLISAFETVPREWYDNDERSIIQLLHVLDSRRTKIRALLWATAIRLPKLFRNWNLEGDRPLTRTVRA
ncbi:MAG: HipA family kinase [Candidatus Acidiferrales bacterium]